MVMEGLWVWEGIRVRVARNNNIITKKPKNNNII